MQSRTRVRLCDAWSAPAEWRLSDPTQAQVTITAPGTFGAAALLSVTVSDSHGTRASASVLVRTRQNDGPELSALSASPTLVTPGAAAVLVADAISSVGLFVTYRWSVDSAGWILDTNGPVRHGMVRGGEWRDRHADRAPRRGGNDGRVSHGLLPFSCNSGTRWAFAASSASGCISSMAAGGTYYWQPTNLSPLITFYPSSAGSGWY